jgi:hypothetical protein
MIKKYRCLTLEKNTVAHLSLLQLVCCSSVVGVQQLVHEASLVVKFKVVQGQVLSLKLTSKHNLGAAAVTTPAAAAAAAAVSTASADGVKDLRSAATASWMPTVTYVRLLNYDFQHTSWAAHAAHLFGGVTIHVACVHLQQQQQQ